MTDLVEVVVRSSSGSSTDVVYQLSAGAKVLELKQKVAERHASHPPPENQRLIFCGRILNNEDVISELGRSVRNRWSAWRNIRHVLTFLFRSLSIVSRSFRTTPF